MVFRYRWAFIGDSPPLSSEFDSVDKKQTESEFVPHIMRLANLLNKKVIFNHKILKICICYVVYEFLLLCLHYTKILKCFIIEIVLYLL